MITSSVPPLGLFATLHVPDTTRPLSGKVMRLMQVPPIKGQFWLFHCLRAGVEVSSGAYPNNSAKSCPLARGMSDLLADGR